MPATCQSWPPTPPRGESSCLKSSFPLAYTPPLPWRPGPWPQMMWPPRMPPPHVRTRPHGSAWNRHPRFSTTSGHAPSWRPEQSSCGKVRRECDPSCRVGGVKGNGTALGSEIESIGMVGELKWWALVGPHIEACLSASGPTLVPLVDFLNHSRPPCVVCRAHTEQPLPKHSIYSPPSTPSSCTSEDSGDALNDSLQPQQQFVCEALCDLPAGQELLWVYNSHCLDVGWLLGYGFVPCDGTSSPAPPDQGLLLPQGLHMLEGASSLSEETSKSLLQTRVLALDATLTRIEGLRQPLQSRASGIAGLLRRERDALLAA